MPQILIIDDDQTVCLSLKLLLSRAGYEVDFSLSPSEGTNAIATKDYDLLLLDMNFTISSTGQDGLQTLEEILVARPDLPVILITAWATVQLAVEGMKRGARDFLAKPWDNAHLLKSVASVLNLYGQKRTANDHQADADGFGEIVGRSSELKEVLDMAKRVARTEASVLITGESGTGKELIAKAIHESSERAKHPIVAVNLGGIPEGLFESEMFGHRAGAFTDAKRDRKGHFEMAEGGTLFLDEIGDLPLSGQVKLLRVLQERYFTRLGDSKSKKADFRLISATSRVLPELITEGRFREDLLYRINLVTLHLPPLRRRPEDIAELAEHFLTLGAKLHHTEKPDLSSDALKWLQRQSWPGNIRQLKNVIERSIIFARDNKLTPTDLEVGYQAGQSKKIDSLPAIELADMEERMIKAALARHNNQITATAAELGLTRPALYRRMEKYGIAHERS
ncbi:MAG: sigma-54 dependent transcriptional regulator [Bacteroidota bacterium]